MVARTFVEHLELEPMTFELRQKVQVTASGVQGTVIARTESVDADPVYLVEFYDGIYECAAIPERALQSVSQQ